MQGRDDCVTQLADLAGISPVSSQTYDWAAIETSLAGLTLPSDYKRLIQTFPDGKFRDLVRIIRPGDVGSPRTDYLGFYANWLEDMRQWRADGDGLFPYPIHPEPAGLLPFAEGPGGEMCFWLTNSGDPDAWPVVSADRDFLQWQEYPGPMCRFLSALVEGTIPSPFDPATAVGSAAPAFRPIGAQPSTAVAATPTQPGTAAPLWGRQPPQNESAELLAVIGDAPAAPSADWTQVAKILGVDLPTDYQTIVDHVGVGVFCDIRILGPDPCPDFNLTTVLAVEAARVAASHAGVMAAYHPQPAGVIPWGVTADGWICVWRTLQNDPNLWTVAMIAPNFNTIFHDELSFSSFLLKYCGQRDQTGVFFGRAPWQGGATFVGHRHE
ncbi:hypothetical protein HDA40_001938 [Hamadaea flava]|uniref:Knr4/Smi1-like domain-containing protein n=1 Tax=Hamadaea flava TaxID=1742688 RepID=A0ABV8LFJ9_9ACTN|nr:hypothetical protein [Hamadaea flava]MCP2323431.1 hypothetical protein [Hamadaea flava]